MVIALWIVNIVLALGFLGSGLLKLTQRRERLSQRGLGWTDDFPAPFVKLLGVLEVIGALGLVLPLFTHTALILAPLAALGLTVIMIGAVVVHIRRRESFLPSLILGIIAIVSSVLGFLQLSS